MVVGESGTNIHLCFNLVTPSFDWKFPVSVWLAFCSDQSFDKFLAHFCFFPFLSLTPNLVSHHHRAKTFNSVSLTQTHTLSLSFWLENTRLVCVSKLLVILKCEICCRRHQMLISPLFFFVVGMFCGLQSVITDWTPRYFSTRTLLFPLIKRLKPEMQNQRNVRDCLSWEILYFWCSSLFIQKSRYSRTRL